MGERFATPEVTVVTGASGWLGRALVNRLRGDRSRQRLRLLAATTEEGRQLELLGDVEVVVGDITKSDTAARLLHGVGPDSDIIHTVGIIHPTTTRQFFEINVVGVRNVTDAALDHGVRRLVHVSSNSPFGTNAQTHDTFRAVEPYHPYLGYGWSKMEGELAVLDAVERGLDATIVRPPWFYGPFQPPRQTTFFRLVRSGRFPVVGDGEQRRSMVYIENLVDGVLAAELTPAARGHGYWVADAAAYTVNEIVATVGRALRDEGFDVKDPATRLPSIAGRLAEAGDRLLQRFGRYQQQLHVLGEMNHTIACDISATTNELGYRPRVGLYEGMRASIHWCVEQGLDL